MTTASSRQMMYAQIVSQPALLRETFAMAQDAVAEALDRFQPQRWQMLYTAGCGDSFYAGLACELALASLCRLPVKALAAMHFARYEVDRVPVPALLLGISNSGQVSRSIEAVTLARAAGLDTIAVTGNGSSGIAHAAAAAMAVPIAAMGRSPGIRSYTIQLLTLYLCAIRLGELRQVLTPAEAEGWRQQLRAVADGMEATIEASDALARQATSQHKDTDVWVFLGSGPSYATSLFSAAKLVESCGANAWGQDVEEWGHIQFFNTQETTPTCLIMPPGRSQDRMLEILPYVKGVGRYTIVVGHGDASSWPADVVLPVPQTVPEMFSPLVYCLAGELLAYYLAEARHAEFFQSSRPYGSSGARLRGSYMTQLHDLATRQQGVTDEL